MKILFVCVENACRSQMAEGIFNHLAKGKHKAFSSGISLAKEVNPLAIKVMAEIDIDISEQKPRLLNPEIVKDVDKVISMGCIPPHQKQNFWCGGIDGCPAVKIDEDWSIEDPKGKSIEKFREVRDIIYKRIKDEEI